MDIWRPGFVRATLAEILEAGSLEGFDAEWLLPQEPRFTFLADPFGVTRGDLIHVFVEKLDYRDRKGKIEVLTFDREMQLANRQICLSEPWHLSFPVAFQSDGEDYLLPEAHRSGGLYLYRAADFPSRWERLAKIELPHVPVDATPLFHDDLWWLFHGRAGDIRGELHLAYSERISGHWRPHPSSPLVLGPRGSRPAGLAMKANGKLVLPVQDGSKTYGGAVRALWIDELDTLRAECRHGPVIGPTASMAPFCNGLHTLSACGEITLFDAKRIDHSLLGQMISLRGKAVRAVRQSPLLLGEIPIH
jgi:hypothetical protein